LGDFIIEKCVIDVTAMFATNFVSFICTDGTVDQRERISFTSFPEPQPNFDEIHNMGHAGFRFKPGTEICENKSSCYIRNQLTSTDKTIGLSPNQCAALRVTSDDRVQLACFEQIRGKITGMVVPFEDYSKLNYDTDELMLPMVAAVAQQHAFGCKNGHNNDDLLCAIQNYKSPVFNKLLLRETHRSLSFSLDFTGEQPNEKLFRNPTVQKCLSLQNILDYAGDEAKKSLPAKMAWILLLIRIASFAFGSTVNLFHREGDSDVKAEELQPLIGIAKWTTDLFAYIVDGLFELKRLVKGREKDLPFVRQKAVELNSPALFLVLASGSRVLLRYCSRGLKSLQQKIDQRLKQKNIHDGDTYTTLKTILLIFDNCPAKVPQFERIITDLESNVRVVYQGIKEEDRGIAERAVFVDNTIPPVFLSPVEFLFRNSLKKLWEETDLDRLHFYDLSWLGLHDDYLTIQYVKKNPIDIIRKTPIRNLNGKMIRCVRCCSQIEDADKHKAWIGNLGRMCVCGSLWMVQEVEKLKVNGDVAVPMINVGPVNASGHVHV
jgi:mediator of RNA polymerase II transcription subunit 16, fungi type